MPSPAEWPDDPEDPVPDALDPALRERLRRLYAERFDIAQDGIADDLTGAEAVAREADMRAWLRELARSSADLDARTLFSATGLPLPIAPLPDCATVWKFKRSGDYRKELLRALHANDGTLCNDLLRHRQHVQHLPLDASIVFRLPTPILPLFPVRDLLNATLPLLCQMLQIAESDLYEPMPAKIDKGLSDAGVDICFWIDDNWGQAEIA